MLTCADIGGPNMTEESIRIMEAETYWKIVLGLSITGNASTKRFPNLAIVISFLFTIPTSNAVAERLFSVLKLNKTIHRNALSNPVFSGLVRIKMMLKRKRASADTIEFPEHLIQRVLKVRVKKTIQDEEISFEPSDKESLESS